MIRLQEQYEQAVQFRKRGFTYSEIAKIVGVSKATVSVWLSKKSFSKKVREDNAKRAAKDNSKRIALLNKARSLAREEKRRDALRSAETEFKHYRKDPLFSAGVMLYAAQSRSATQRTIRISSSLLSVHRTFLHFAREYLGISPEANHFQLIAYTHHNVERCERFWSKGLSLKPQQCYKPQVVHQSGQHATLHNGVGNTIIGNTILKIKLDRWVELGFKEW